MSERKTHPASLKIAKLRKTLGISERQLAKDLGVSHSSLNTWMKSNNPPFDLLDRIANYFDIEVSFFSRLNPSVSLQPTSGQEYVNRKVIEMLDAAIQNAADRHSQQGQPISLQSFLDWWYVNSGRLESFEQLRPKVDLFAQPNPNDRQISPRETGILSLAATELNIKCTDHLLETLNGFDEETNRDLVEAHLHAIKHGEPVLSHPTLDAPRRDGTWFKRKYRRVLAPVTLPNGEVLIANFCQDLPAHPQD